MLKVQRPRAQFISGLLAVVVLASVSLAACGNNERSVKIVTPAQGADVPAGDVRVAVDVKKFNVVDKIGEAAVEGEGHIHYYIDAGQIPTKDGQPAVTSDQRTYHAQATKEFTWSGVSPGEHTFAVQLVNNDHTPLRPPVIAQVTVEVTAAGGATAPARSPTGSPARTTPPEETQTSTPGGGGATSPAATERPSPTATTTLPVTTPTP